jgi:hypothetical protein
MIYRGERLTNPCAEVLLYEPESFLEPQIYQKEPEWCHDITEGSLILMKDLPTLRSVYSFGMQYEDLELIAGKLLVVTDVDLRPPFTVRTPLLVWHIPYYMIESFYPKTKQDEAIQ